MEKIDNISELLERIDAALIVRRSDIAAGSALCGSFYFDPPEEIRAEIAQHRPGSYGSYEAQMRLIYKKIAGQDHKIEMEGLDTDFMNVANAFPFCLPSKESGYWTMAYGYFVHCLDLPAGARVLEIGFGAGGLTELLVRSGLNVTAVELRESNCETLRNRVAAFQGQVHCIKADSVALYDYPGKYDAIIFYEAFHHMPAPLELLRHLRNYLTPGGFFAFGAEPIQPPSVYIPFPWGLRMDGGSLGAIRDVGWVEFGFHEDFFIEMLSEIGHSATRAFLPGFMHCDVWIARPSGSLV